jgi:hypothetical protein
MRVEANTDPVPLLQSVRDELPEGRVSVGWLYGKLEGQGICLFLLILGLLGAFPGIDTPAGVVIGLLGCTMLWSAQPQLPSNVAAHRIATRPARYAIGRAINLLTFIEQVFPSFDGEVSVWLRPVAALVLILLGAAMLLPIPLSNVAPSLAAAMMAVALVEGSIASFLAALTSAAAALGLTGYIVLEVLRGIGWF